MFILDSTDGGTTMFIKGQNVESDIDLWYKRIGHVNYQLLQDLQLKQVVFGLPKFSGRKTQICEASQLGKEHRLPFPNERNQSRNKLDLIHSDVWGPTQNVSVGGSRYFVSFIDDYTHHTWIYLIERKSEVFNCFRDLKGFVETETGRKIKCLRWDGGKEYFSGQFNDYLQQMGIQREFSCRYTPEQNGVAKRKNQSVVEAAREMLEEKSMPKFYWAEAVQTAVYIQNRIGEKVSAHELYFRRNPNYDT